MIILLSRDLMAISTIENAARSRGLRVRTQAAVAAAVESSEPVSLIVVDLASTGQDVATIVTEMRGRHPAAQIFAFGPHVNAAELEQAAAAGCDKAMARGQFLGQLSAILGRAVNDAPEY